MIMKPNLSWLFFYLAQVDENYLQISWISSSFFIMRHCCSGERCGPWAHPICVLPQGQRWWFQCHMIFLGDCLEGGRAAFSSAFLSLPGQAHILTSTACRLSTLFSLSSVKTIWIGHLFGHQHKIPNTWSETRWSPIPTQPGVVHVEWSHSVLRFRGPLCIWLVCVHIL